VVDDPKHFLASATLHVRRRGERGWWATDLELPRPGAHRRVLLPRFGADHPEVVQLFLSAYDRAGNEVLRWSEPDHPRDVALSYRPPPRWYQKWWIWAIGGTAVAAATGLVIFAIAYDPPETVGGVFHF
jgi:hypothetical protein